MTVLAGGVRFRERTYPALERIAALCVNSTVSHHVLERIVRVATITSVVTIGDCEWLRGYIIVVCTEAKLRKCETF